MLMHGLCQPPSTYSRWAGGLYAYKRRYLLKCSYNLHVKAIGSIISPLIVSMLVNMACVYRYVGLHNNIIVVQHGMLTQLDYVKPSALEIPYILSTRI